MAWPHIVFSVFVHSLNTNRWVSLIDFGGPVGSGNYRAFTLFAFTDMLQFTVFVLPVYKESPGKAIIIALKCHGYSYSCFLVTAMALGSG